MMMTMMTNTMTRQYQQWWLYAAPNSWATELHWLDLSLGQAMMATRSSQHQNHYFDTILWSPLPCHQKDVFITIHNIFHGQQPDHWYDHQCSCYNDQHCDEWCQLGSGEVRSGGGRRRGRGEEGKRAKKLLDQIRNVRKGLNSSLICQNKVKGQKSS